MTGDGKSAGRLAGEFVEEVARYEARNRRYRLLTWTILGVVGAAVAIIGCWLLFRSCGTVWAQDADGKPVRIQVCGGDAWVVP